MNEGCVCEKVYIFGSLEPRLEFVEPSRETDHEYMFVHVCAYVHACVFILSLDEFSQDYLEVSPLPITFRFTVLETPALPLNPPLGV